MEKICSFSSVDQLDSDTELQVQSDKCIPYPSPLLKREQIRQNLKNQLFAKSKFNEDFNSTKKKFKLDEIETSKVFWKPSSLGSCQNESQQKDQEDSEKQQSIYNINRHFGEIFEEIGIIGQGCSGLVKKMKKMQTEEYFAVKQIRTRDEERIQNIKNEFLHMKNLKHPNIVEVYELYIDEYRGNVYIVMEMIEGQEMFEVIKQLGSYNESTAKGLFKQILESIDFMHKKKICHRDLKPSNIICNKDGTKLKITDFNVSKFQDTEENMEDSSQEQQSQGNVTSSQELQMWTNTGTVQYQAPEMFNGESYTELVDIWSSGVILYTMLSGKEPFQSLYVDDIIKKITNGKFTFSDKIWQNISAEAKDLICKCLTIDPQQRIKPQDAIQHPWFQQKMNSVLLCEQTSEINLNQFIDYRRRRCNSEYFIQIDGLNGKKSGKRSDSNKHKKSMNQFYNPKATHTYIDHDSVDENNDCNGNINNSIEIESPIQEKKKKTQKQINQELQSKIKRKYNLFLDQIPEVDDGLMIQEMPLNSLQIQKKIKQF